MMTSGEFNARFRPLVDQAWILNCQATGIAANNATERDHWYRNQIRAGTGGRIASTKHATAQERTDLLHWFHVLVAPSQPPSIDGWTEPQNDHFASLAQSAWTHAQTGAWENMDAWLDALLADNGIVMRYASNRVESFDRVMAALAITAGDQYWIERTAWAAEIRMRYQIRRCLATLSAITGRIHDWNYCRGIWKQADQLPHDMNEAPAKLLWLLLQILDSHVRKGNHHERELAQVPAHTAAPAPAPAPAAPAAATQQPAMHTSNRG